MGLFDFLFGSKTKNTNSDIMIYEKINDYTVIDLETSSKYTRSETSSSLLL